LPPSKLTSIPKNRHVAYTYTTHGFRALLRLRARRPISTTLSAARRLHESTFTAFAQADVPALAAACEDSLLRAFRARLSRRPADERLEWRRLALVGRPRLVSFKTAQTGVLFRGEPLVVQQAVVRMRSRQMLRQGTLGGGGGGSGSGDSSSSSNGGGGERDVVEQIMGDVARVEWQQNKEKDIVEYVVVMRRFLDEEPTDWKIWGFVKPPSAKDETAKREETKVGGADPMTNGAAAASSGAS
jgi:hypothetical protein